MHNIQVVWILNWQNLHKPLIAPCTFSVYLLIKLPGILTLPIALMYIQDEEWHVLNVKFTRNVHIL